MFSKNEEEINYLAQLFEAALGESPAYAMRLAKRWRQDRVRAKGFWQESAMSSFDQTQQRAQKIVMRDENILRQYLNCYEGGIVLLTIHMGDYLHSIFRILSAANRRKVVILRRKSWSDNEERSFNKIAQLGHDVETVRHGPKAAMSITKSLRDGAVAVLLYDLPYQWGATENITVFNQQLHWVIGPFQIALLGRASVIPFYSFSMKSKCFCDLMPVRDYREISIDRKKFLRAEMQIAATTAEKYIKQFASQWNHWLLMSDMIHEGQHD